MMKRRILAGLLAFALVTILSACGGDGAEGGILTPDGGQAAAEQGETAGGLSPEMEAVIQSVNAENAEAAGVCGADLVWYYKDGVLVISGTGEMLSYDLLIGDPPWADLKDDVNLVYLAPGVTSVGSWTFLRFTYLSRVVLPDTLEEIGEGAFRYCDMLQEFVVPASVTRIGWKAICADSVTFLGDAPEPEDPDSTDCWDIFDSCSTVHYSGEGFEPYMEYYAGESGAAGDITWVKD